MKQLHELTLMLGEGYLPAGATKIGLRVRKLHAYLKETENPTDEGAAGAIGTEGGSSTFRKAKHYLKLALINGVLAVDAPKEKISPDRLSANDRIWNHIQGARCGTAPANQVFVDKIAEFCLEDARAYDIQEPLLIGALTTMNSQYLRSLRKSKFFEFLEMVKEELEYDYKLQVCYKHSRHFTFMNIIRKSPEEKAEYLASSVREIESINAASRFRTEHIYLKLMLRFKMEQGDYEDAIQFAKYSLGTFDEGDKLQKQTIRIFQNTLTRAYLISGRYEEGLAFTLSVLNKTDPKKVFMYYAVKELTIVTAMKGGNYQVAYDHYLDVLEGNLGAGLKSNYEETLAIIEAYLILLAELGLVNMNDRGTALNKLRLGKFLNETITSQKEKSLRNLHVIIIKILDHALFKRNKDFDQADAIRKYVQRHLTEPDTARAKNFILALVKFPENGYNKKMVTREAAKYLARLRSYEVGAHHQHPYGEIVLYENIWKYLIEA